MDTKFCSYNGGGGGSKRLVVCVECVQCTALQLLLCVVFQSGISTRELARPSQNVYTVSLYLI